MCALRFAFCLRVLVGFKKGRQERRQERRLERRRERKQETRTAAKTAAAAAVGRIRNSVSATRLVYLGLAN